MRAPGNVQAAHGGLWGVCRFCEIDIAVEIPVEYGGLAWVADQVRAHLRDEHRCPDCDGTGYIGKPQVWPCHCAAGVFENGTLGLVADRRARERG